ncbi:MAG TPA: HD domain-containing protein [Bacteroidetes bacterium]|nr:HD domain-containing protein [Bacteroidota bacterium]HIL58661.1 HD domain-containing protein [Rhodothermales bacterium]
MLFSPLVERAIEIAAEWHDGTYRKGRWTDPVLAPPQTEALAPGVPAMSHVTTVALTVARAGWSDETIAAAFLHDTLEDRDRHARTLAADRLAALVGEEVVAIVEAVTEPKVDDAGRPLAWRVRKDAYLATLRAASAEAAAVSLADKLHNAYAMASSLEAGVDIFRAAPGRTALSAGAEDQLWYFRAVVEATAHHEDPRLDALRARLAKEIERFAAAVGLA